MWLSLTVPGPWDKQKNDLTVAPTISASCGVFFDSKGRAGDRIGRPYNVLLW